MTIYRRKSLVSMYCGPIMIIHVSSKHEMFTQCWFNVGPASQTVGQHWANIRWTSLVRWARLHVYINDESLSSFHQYDTVNLHCLNSGPAALTLGQHWTNVDSECGIFIDGVIRCIPSEVFQPIVSHTMRLKCMQFVVYKILVFYFYFYKLFSTFLQIICTTFVQRRPNVIKMFVFVGITLMNGEI